MVNRLASDFFKLQDRIGRWEAGNSLCGCSLAALQGITAGEPVHLELVYYSEASRQGWVGLQ